MKVISIASLYLILFVAVEVITKRTGVSKELSRKVVHVVAGTTAALLPLVMTFTEIAVLSLLFIPVMLVSKRANIFSSIHHVARRTYGEVYFPFAILITALVFPKTELYMYGLLVMAVSDGFASIVGQKYGKNTYRLFGAKKSYEGSVVFFVTAVAIGLGVLTTLTAVAAPAAVVISLGVGLLLTFVEAGLGRGLDNLVVPPLAALLMQIVLLWV